MIGFCPLASGSKGNCIYLGTERTKILIDAGISCRLIQQRLEKIDVALEDIDAILVTHEHTDHIKAIQTLSSHYNIPVFANSDTAKAIYEAIRESPKFKIFSTGETFEFGDMEIHPFSVQHDALDPVAFTIRYEHLKMGFCTDLGFATSLVASQLMECDYLYLEANHEPSMVHSSARPDLFKKRVLGRQGHLSNQECGDLIVKVLNDKLKRIYLAHLSEECNTAELAIKIIQEKLRACNEEIELSIAFQDEISRPTYF